MTYHPGLPWPAIHEFLLNIEQTDQAVNLCRQAVLALQPLIPFETAYILFFDAHFQVIDHQVFGVPDQLIRQFLDYYIAIDPCRQKTPPNAKAWRLDWSEFQHTEFQTDFGRRADIRYTTSMYLHHPNQQPGAIIFMTRSGNRGFDDRDFAIWEVIQPHLSNLFAITEKLKQPGDGPREDVAAPHDSARNLHGFHPLELSPGHKLLSKREAEVTALLCQRLTVPEIASRLVISPHTVRTYIENIKEKLQVKNRRELILKLGDPTRPSCHPPLHISGPSSKN